jgi:hypothetical protein
LGHIRAKYSLGVRCAQPQYRACAFYKSYHLALIVLVVCLFLPGPWSSFIGYGHGFIGKERDTAVKEALVGQWVAEVGRTKLNLRLTSDDLFNLDDKKGVYSVEGSLLKLRHEGGEVGYQFDLAGDLLALSGGDLGQALKFSRRPEGRSYLRRLFRLSPHSVGLKAERILGIVAIMVLSGLIIMVMRQLSYFVISSEWGPLQYLYAHHKNRAMTMNSLVLNVLKYIIYFTALGFILAELGVNYKAYLASLSVIGLAIGFGSQGLVQDMVTGFFLIFEGQFDVGDMVEVSGQIGKVEELGLRMTKLRNYLGQLLMIPNRNIAMVGNYTKGALQAFVDVAAKSAEAAEQGAALLQQIGDEMHLQFQGVILTRPRLLRPLSLKTGEHFIRMYLEIWPQQQWVIDQQLVPRIREIMKSKGFEIPGDFVATFYRAREERPVKGWPWLLKRRQKPS